MFCLINFFFVCVWRKLPHPTAKVSHQKAPSPSLPHAFPLLPFGGYLLQNKRQEKGEEDQAFSPFLRGQSVVFPRRLIYQQGK